MVTFLFLFFKYTVKERKKNSIVILRQARFKGYAGLTIEMQIVLCKEPPAVAQIFTDQVLLS